MFYCCHFLSESPEVRDSQPLFQFTQKTQPICSDSLLTFLHLHPLNPPLYPTSSYPIPSHHHPISCPTPVFWLQGSWATYFRPSKSPRQHQSSHFPSIKSSIMYKAFFLHMQKKPWVPILALPLQVVLLWSSCPARYLSLLLPGVAPTSSHIGPWKEPQSQGSVQFSHLIFISYKV